VWGKVPAPDSAAFDGKIAAWLSEKAYVRSIHRSSGKTNLEIAAYIANRTGTKMLLWNTAVSRLKWPKIAPVYLEAFQRMGYLCLFSCNYGLLI
jgi:hypothetical protein